MVSRHQGCFIWNDVRSSFACIADYSPSCTAATPDESQMVEPPDGDELSSEDDEDDIPMPLGPPPGGYSDTSSDEEGRGVPTLPPGFIPPLPKGRYHYPRLCISMTETPPKGHLHPMRYLHQVLYHRLTSLLPHPPFFLTRRALHRRRHHQAFLPFCR